VKKQVTAVAATAGLGMLVATPTAATIVTESEPNDSFATANTVDFAAGEDEARGKSGADSDPADHWLFTNLPTNWSAQFTVSSVIQIASTDPSFIFQFDFFHSDDLLTPVATVTVDEATLDATYPLTASFTGTVPATGAFGVRVTELTDEIFDSNEDYSIAVRVVSEPAAVGLFTAGLIGLAAWRRKQKKPAAA